MCQVLLINQTVLLDGPACWLKRDAFVSQWHSGRCRQLAREDSKTIPFATEGWTLLGALVLVSGKPVIFSCFLVRSGLSFFGKNAVDGPSPKPQHWPLQQFSWRHCFWNSTSKQNLALIGSSDCC
jgi:hypothetical protein